MLHSNKLSKLTNWLITENVHYEPGMLHGKRQLGLIEQKQPVFDRQAVTTKSIIVYGSLSITLHGTHICYNGLGKNVVQHSSNFNKRKVQEML
jgi:hypothetical protein